MIGGLFLAPPAIQPDKPEQSEKGGGDYEQRGGFGVDPYWWTPYGLEDPREEDR